MSRILRRVSVYAFLVAVCACALGPTLWVMVASFKTGGQVLSGGGLLPDPFTLDGYRAAFRDADIERYLLNTALYATCGTLGAVTTALLAAYPTTRYGFRGRNALIATFSLAMAIPVVGLATPEFFIVRELGLFDTRAGLILFYSALFFPLSFVILRAFLASLPPELEEAALLDGAGYATIVWRIVVPLVRPALATVAVIDFVTIWNEFFFANLLTASPDNQNVQLALATLRSQFGFDVGGALAGATLVMLVPIGLFLVLQRQVVSGLTAGTTR